MELTATEREQGRLWVKAVAEAIADVARECGATRVLIGVGMPGLKTPDGRGICVVNNGPRIPDYVNMLEQKLLKLGLDLVAPVAGLGSDADYCGLGEEYAAGGLFRDVDNAYYCGGGTGIADALKLRGTVVPFDDAREWILKAWQMPSALGPTFEKLVSASALNRVHTRLRDPALESVDVYPEGMAEHGDPLSKGWLVAAALVLAELLFERLWTVKHGAMEAPHRGRPYAQLVREHPYRNTLLDRVIVGQRVGLIYADARYRTVFGDPLDTYLTALIANSGDDEMLAAYLSPDGRRLREGFLQASKLRAAPALGAAVAAVRAWQQ